MESIYSAKVYDPHILKLYDLFAENIRSKRIVNFQIKYRIFSANDRIIFTNDHKLFANDRVLSVKIIKFQLGSYINSQDRILHFP